MTISPHTQVITPAMMFGLNCSSAKISGLALKHVLLSLVAIPAVDHIIQHISIRILENTIQKN